MSSSICFNMEQSKILSSGNGLNHILLYKSMDISLQSMKTKIKWHVCAVWSWSSVYVTVIAYTKLSCVLVILMMKALENIVWKAENTCN